MWISYLQGSRSFSSFCSLSHSGGVSITSLLCCWSRVAFIAAWLRFRRLTISSVQIYRGETSWISGSCCHPRAACCACSSEAFARLCLKWPTIFRHFSKTFANPVSERLTVMLLCRMWAMHGMCSYGSSRAAAIILRALSVPIDVIFSVNCPLACYYLKLFCTCLCKVTLFCFHHG